MTVNHFLKVIARHTPLKSLPTARSPKPQHLPNSTAKSLQSASNVHFHAPTLNAHRQCPTARQPHDHKLTGLRNLYNAPPCLTPTVFTTFVLSVSFVISTFSSTLPPNNLNFASHTRIDIFDVNRVRSDPSPVSPTNQESLAACDCASRSVCRFRSILSKFANKLEPSLTQNIIDQAIASARRLWGL